ncbi:rhamnan synthesis F family protein [Ancylobacter pratisalsi]|uniref:Glycosyltransferase n=1 Tax=Ancylobacter pratisalsi TaxID=1745854 RepID=A0A6P1YP48_9HYPH|nr:rhamnan synthesis F family protein [Ancylobacter pratisalsi]QIB34486.1 glycosyltransferase [Ancylobacter pratisalsi]
MLDRQAPGESAAVSAGLLLASPAFSAERYRIAAGLGPDEDAALHYVTTGWKEGREPLRGVETAYLAPYLESIGITVPPAIAWLQFELMGIAMPPTRKASVALARDIARTVGFDEAYYRKWAPHVADPALHYVLVGEKVGLRPNPEFDPAYYAETYHDLTAARRKSRLVLHFDGHGRAEGRRPRSFADELQLKSLPGGGPPPALVICHEASRTGAPILGWNILRVLKHKRNVVSVLLHGGALEEEFAAVAGVGVPALVGIPRAPVEMRRIAKRLMLEYKPLYVIANSIEAEPLATEFAKLGVPVIALIHEFSTYTRPLTKLQAMCAWASEVVFPARIVAQSSYKAVVGFDQRPGVHILPQGRSDLPPPPEPAHGMPMPEKKPPVRLRPPGQEDAIVVLGAGWVQLRKGVEVFVETAAVARRLRPDLKLRFVWVGDGFDPERDLNYSIYLDEQIQRSNLGDSFAMVPAVTDIEDIYRQTDIFLLSSRLDPQPNVAIDAISLGIPVVCFEGAAGTAEVLADNPGTRDLVVPHLDATAAAQLICRLADDAGERARLREELIRLAGTTFDMETYVSRLDEMGQRAAKRLTIPDEIHAEAMAAIDPFMLFDPNESWPPPQEWPRIAVIKWRLLRRAVPGFHPLVYALAHPAACLEDEQDPLMHWLGAGRPQGPWSRTVYSPRTARESSLRVALHGHFHYPELIDDFVDRLRTNATSPDVFLTTDSEVKAEILSRGLTRYGGTAEVRVVPNVGRDVGPFLTGLADVIAGGAYDVIGHVHAKRSLSVDAELGERWRNFLWTNLVGGRRAMVDTAAAAFEEDPELGLLMAEDPHVVGWSANREIGEDLARRMGIVEPLPDAFDFPLGTMFWARPQALRPLLDLGLDWADYPTEPLPGDGTLLHAIERLMPFVARKAGLNMAGLRVPGTGW